VTGRINTQQKIEMLQPRQNANPTGEVSRLMLKEMDCQCQERLMGKGSCIFRCFDVAFVYSVPLSQANDG